MITIFAFRKAQFPFQLQNTIENMQKINLCVCRQKDAKDTRRFGEMQRRLIKQISGGLILVGLIVLIWFPLLILSIPGASSDNPVVSMSITAQIDGYQPLYTQIVSSAAITNLTLDDFKSIKADPAYSDLFPSYLAYGSFQKFVFSNVFHCYATDFSPQ